MVTRLLIYGKIKTIVEPHELVYFNLYSVIKFELVIDPVKARLVGYWLDCR